MVKLLALLLILNFSSSFAQSIPIDEKDCNLMVSIGLSTFFHHEEGVLDIPQTYKSSELSSKNGFDRTYSVEAYSDLDKSIVFNYTAKVKGLLDENNKYEFCNLVGLIENKVIF